MIGSIRRASRDRPAARCALTLVTAALFAAAVLVAIATLPLYGPLAAHPLMLVPYGPAR